MVRLWDLRGIGLAAKLAWRIVLPVYFRGEMVSWTSRAPSDDAVLRYVSASPDQEKIDHHTLLYGGDYLRHSVIVCEGAFDAMRIGPGAVALLGSNMTMPQLLALSMVPLRCICLDNEPAAQKRARKYADDLSVFPGTTEIVTLDAKDAGSASDNEIRELRKRYLE